MASKRRLRAKKCGDKQRFRSYDAAFAARFPNRLELQPYGCAFCGQIHLGHPGKAGKQRQASRSALRRKKGV